MHTDYLLSIARRKLASSNLTDTLSQQETAVKSPNGSAEIRAQGGKSFGRGAVEGCDTHLSKWTAKRSWVFSCSAFAVWIYRPVSADAGQPTGVGSSAHQQQSGGNDGCWCLTWSVQHLAIITPGCCSAFTDVLPLLADKRADLHSGTHQVCNSSDDWLLVCHNWDRKLTSVSFRIPMRPFGLMSACLKRCTRRSATTFFPLPATKPTQSPAAVLQVRKR